MKNKISRISPERKMEIKELLELIRQESYDQGYEDGKAFVSVETVEDNTIIHEGKLLRKVNRSTREGDYVRPNKQRHSPHLDAGKIYGPVSTKGRTLYTNGFQVYQPFHNRTSSTVEVFEVVESVQPKSPNEQRAELIEKAKKFLRINIYDRRELAGLSGNEISFNYQFLNLEFIVNTQKRVVIALLKNRYSKKVDYKAKAKCMHGEVFNEVIGKAIALGKLLKIDIPIEFLEAVQPSEFSQGQIVKVDHMSHLGEHEITKIKNENAYFNYEGSTEHHYASRINEPGYKIIDDSNAKYEVTS